MRKWFERFSKDSDIIKTDNDAMRGYRKELFILTGVFFVGTLAIQRFVFPWIHPIAYYIAFVAGWLVMMYFHTKETSTMVVKRAEQRDEYSHQYREVNAVMDNVFEENRELKRQLAIQNGEAVVTDDTALINRATLAERKKRSQRKYGFGKGSYKRY